MTPELIRAARAYIRYVDDGRINHVSEAERKAKYKGYAEGCRRVGIEPKPQKAYSFTKERTQSFDRALFGSFGGGGKCGICKWCRQPCEGRRKWHEVCLSVYATARGLTVLPNTNRPIIPYTPCALCPDLRFDKRPYGGEEIDHKIALSIAWQTGARDLIQRAWWVGNLQWVCPECHVKKTAADRKLLAYLRRGGIYVYRLAMNRAEREAPAPKQINLFSNGEHDAETNEISRLSRPRR